MTNKKYALLRRTEARRWIALGTVAAVGLATAGPVHAVTSDRKLTLAHASQAPFLLAAAVEGGASVADAKAAFDEVIHEIDEAREHTGGGEAVRLVSVALITREAAEEYEAASADGKFANIHEYQDAWGFIESARAVAAELAGSPRPEVVAALAIINAQFEVIAPAFSGPAPGADLLPADPSLIYGAAARMELAALSVK